MKKSRSRMEDYVLDAVGQDADTFEEILRLVNDEQTGWRKEHGGPISPGEVQAALISLVHQRLVEVQIPGPSDLGLVGCGEGIWPSKYHLHDIWFELTGRGQVLYLNLDL